MKRKENIYTKIFDITTSNMEDSGKEYYYTSDMCYYMSERIPNIVDLDKLRYLDNLDFLKMAFLELLQRPIDEKAMEHYSQFLDKEKEEFQIIILRAITNSIEFKMKDICIKNNPYILRSEKRKVIIQTKDNVYITSRVMRIYKSLPKNMRIMIRKIAGV